MSSRLNIDALAPDTTDVTVATNGAKANNNFLNLLLWFLIIAVIVYIILYLLKPAFVQSRDANGVQTGNVDVSKALITSIVVALVIILILYLLRGR